MIVRGGCLCGAVTYEAHLPFAKFVICHCSRCRKVSGSAYAANAYVSPEAFRWTSRENVVVRYDLPEALKLRDVVLRQVRVTTAASHEERTRDCHPEPARSMTIPEWSLRPARIGILARGGSLPRTIDRRQNNYFGYNTESESDRDPYPASDGRTFGFVKLDAERLGEARATGRRKPQRPAVRLALEPAKRQQTVQDSRANQAADVIAALAPVETRLAENPPGPRRQIDAEGGKETLARRRDLTAFIGEYDVPHGHKCIGHSDAHPAGQMVVATSGKTECIVVCRPRLTARRHLYGGDDLHALQHRRDQRRRDPIIIRSGRLRVTIKSRAATSLLRWPLAVEREILAL